MSNPSPLAENLAKVRQRIAAAAQRSGRPASEITLVAVTKYVAAEVAKMLVEAGCLDLGESRPQELWHKAEALGTVTSPQPAAQNSIRWHLIGHLQRNKVDHTVPLVSLIHSVDSWRLLETLDRAAQGLPRPLPLLLEVNISGDASKHGFAPDAIEPILASAAGLAALEIRGLMTMASRAGDLAQAHREFAQLRVLRDLLRQVAPSHTKLPELSMGMSGDFEAAIEEGATIVRVGSALFEGVVEI